ncbi:MAG: 50S ribosomal protein L3 N(5)-glutamine methyltransferase [Gammaproteobacteria bacterium]|nr:50S ribosomal protein L3 N(5)-glutamine methyltransferase [Gammaproteobacteria bacterium]MCH9744204.1 50S ribosomal protein L3 N(5)-glutamine methyltransferase [Gammaproteobacteria bacterium]
MSQKHTAAEWLDWVEEQFSQAELFYGHGQDNPHDEAAQLLFFVLDRTDDGVWQEMLTLAQQQKIKDLVSKRIHTRRPLAYLTQQAWFMGMPFYVDERVLIPRSPFAEWIDYQFAPWVQPDSVKHILEIGTGSGCMAIACAEVFPNTIVDAVDIDAGALMVAAKNIAHYKMQERVHLIESDAFSNVTRKDYDVIISNPPYVGDAEIASLPKEYSFEPVEIALRSGKDGLKLPLQILTQAAEYLQDKGVLIMELGNTAELLQQRFPKVAFTWLEQSMGGHGLLMMTKEDLLNYQGIFNGG